ncbi:MAG: PD-(D/E)XK nuclease family protein [Pseudomonadota bacterium]
MPSSLLTPAPTLDALADGAVGLTVNQRLSRELREQYAEHQLAQGLTVWRTPTILPWDAWLPTLFQALRRRADIDQYLLTDQQATAVWEDVVQSSSLTPDLLDTQAAAETAQAAWALQYAWRVSASGALSPDRVAYREWSRGFSARCAQQGWQDSATLVDALIEHVQDVAGHLRTELGTRLLLIGFDQLSAAQTAFFARLRECAIDVDIAHLDEGDTNCATLAPCETERDEHLRLATWVRDNLDANPKQRIGVLVPDLQRRRAALVEVLDEVLDPDSSLLPPSRASAFYDLSLGLPLTDYPLVLAALDWLALATQAQPLEHCSRALLSPYLGAADTEAHPRALADARLRNAGFAQMSIRRFTGLIREDRDESFALPDYLDALLVEIDRTPARQSHAQWASTFSAMLEALGWPGERVLDSEEHQTLLAWRECLQDLHEFDAVVPACNATGALRRLNTLSRSRILQVESVASTGVQVMGLLESTGLSFDKVWFVGADANCWPARSRANPLLPIGAQRDAGVPHSSAQWEQAFAERSFRRVLAGASEVIFSYTYTDGDSHVAASPLVASLPPIENVAAGQLSRVVADLHAQSIALDRIDDSLAPPWPQAAPLRGGVRVLEDQAECPFRAFAAHRLKVKTLGELQTGIDDLERGNLLHAVLEQVWKKINSHAELIALDHAQRRHLIESTVAHVVTPERLSVTQAFGDLERQHLVDLVDTWLQFEIKREPFWVEQLEQSHSIVLGPLNFAVRVDRSDRLEDGQRVLIDYKSGKRRSADWAKPRPGDVQLPVYALADPKPVAAVTLAHVRSQNPQFAGVADNGVTISGVDPFDKKFADPAIEDWNAVQSFWRVELSALAQEFADGLASVTPRDATKTCTYCDFTALCRIGSAGGVSDE